MRTRRGEVAAVIGLLVLAAAVSVGGLLLLGAGRPVPAEVWALAGGAVLVVGVWLVRWWVGDAAGASGAAGVSGQTDTATLAAGDVVGASSAAGDPAGGVVKVGVPVPVVGEGPRHDYGGSKAVAEARRLASIIRREPAGWRSYVNVQDWAPNAPKYAWSVAGPVDHCGLSLNTVAHNIGLRMGVHFPDAAWTPSGLAWFQQRGLAVPFDHVAPGDHVYFRSSGWPYSASHVGMATSYWLGGGFNTIEYNTDITGQGREYWRTPGYAVAVCRPLYDVESVPPPPAVGLPLSFKAVPAFI